MKSNTELREILIEIGHYSTEEADDIISPISNENEEAQRTHILSQTGIDVAEY